MLLLSIFLLIGIKPVAVYADGITDAIQKVVNVYPNQCSYFTSDGKSDSNSSDSRCMLGNIPARGRLPSGAEVQASYGTCWSCHAFAEYVWYVMYGHGTNTQSQKISASELKKGDFVRFSGHSAIYLSEDSKNYYVYDSNWASPADNKVRYNHSIAKTRGIEYCYRATNYDEIANSENSTPAINNPYGYLDSCSGGEGIVNISGWTRDDDDPNAGIEIHVYIGGQAGEPDVDGISGIYANQYRSDVGNHAYSAQVKTRKTGTQNIYIYGINIGSGSNTLIASGTVTIIPNENPTISNIRVEDLSSSGYTVRCDVSDNSGIAKVQFPTWTTNNGQDDLQWYEGTVSGNTAECRIDIKNHNNETNCFYVTHIYVDDTVGNSTFGNTGEIYVDSTPPVISNVKIENISTEGFDVLCKIVDNHSINRVKFPTWTRNNWQDDLLSDWLSNSLYDGKINGNTVTYHVNTSDHNNETGVYTVHVYAYDDCQNLTVVGLDINVGEIEDRITPVSTATYKGHTYMLFERTSSEGVSNDKMGWSKVAAYCQSLGGTLACITSEEENEVVASLVGAYGKPCWIGGNALENNGTFVWETGEEFSYTNWDAGEPNNANGNQIFIRMYPSGLWDDFEASGDLAFICEFDNRTSTITYHLNGGINSTDNPDYYYIDNPYVKLPDPVKNGYIFKGWYLSEDGEEAVTEKTKLQGNIELYARWIKEIPEISLSQNGSKLTATVSNTDSVTGYGIVYGKEKEVEVTLDTSGRTRVAFTELTGKNTFVYDMSELTGYTYRAYVSYTDENGKEKVEYSNSVVK